MVQQKNTSSKSSHFIHDKGSLESDLLQQVTLYYTWLSFLPVGAAHSAPTFKNVHVSPPSQIATPHWQQATNLAT